MRAMDIAMFVFVFNLALGMSNSIMAMMLPGYSITNITGAMPQNMTAEQYNSYYYEKINETTIDMNAQENIFTAAFSWFNVIWKGFIMMLTYLVDFLFGLTSNVKNLCDMFLIPDFISLPLQAIVTFVSILGFIQIIMKMSFREQQ